jgi:hypothetical protein
MTVPIRAIDKQYVGKKVLLILVFALILPLAAFGSPYGTTGIVTITGQDNDGIPESVLFSATVTQFPSWVKTTLADRSNIYTFTGRAARHHVRWLSSQHTHPNPRE